MAINPEFVRLSIRRVLCAAAAFAGLGACAADSELAGCHYLSSALSGSRSVGGGTVICDPNLVDSAEQVPHADDYVLRNRMW